MSNKGSFIALNQFLSTNDYLVSNNGAFFALMQGDGNLCVYRGTPDVNKGFLWGALSRSQPNGSYFTLMQGDGNLCVYKGTGPSNNQGFVWGAIAHSQPEQAYFAVMQDDGNLCVYKGTGPNDNHGGLWCTNAIDPVVDIEISTINYDLAAAKIIRTTPAELYRQTVVNQTSQPQTSSISGSQSISETSGWSDSLAVKVGVSTSFKTGIPFVAEGKITVSVEVTNTYTWNGSTTQTKTWSFNTPVTVPANTTYVALIAATISTISVPYVMTGTLILKSGARVPGIINGIYTGSNSHDLTVTYINQNAATLGIEVQTQPVEQAKLVA
ncbi:MAG: hypothetical protein EOO68_36015 [Moraxellaceae bacterium]|nr:MAG: hypothetical protein EOO68_36015 [Moraxellaceae bacterium]